MSIRGVASNVGVFGTWFNVLTMSSRPPFKLRPFVLLFGMPCREYRLSFGLIIFIDVASDPCLVMRTGP